MYFRDQKQKFKKNLNFSQNRGLIYSSLVDGKMNIQIINILPEEDKDDSQLSLKQIYQKYKTLIEKDEMFSILEYFEIDDEKGEDVQIHLCIVQQQLNNIKNQYIIKPKKEVINDSSL